MLVQDAIGYAMRVAGILGVGQTALPQDTADAQIALSLMLQQWRQKRWLVFRLNTTIVPLLVGKMSYTVGPAATPNPDFVTDGNFRPANIQSCFLRQTAGFGPNTFPLDFPMRIIQSRQDYDRISLKSLQSWPSAIYYDPTIPNATMYIWPIPIQNLFELYIAWQTAIDVAGEQGLATDLETLLPAETQEAIIYNLAQRLITNYKLPPDANVADTARATLNTLRQTNFAMPESQIPESLRPGTRLRNPMAGIVPEVSSTVFYPTLG